ncbi:MAG: DUF3124 domain-containing protein [Anaerolineae bacterium]|nr:DUF3124 domain-containing protein [Anaerolineae bacterium]
MIYSKRIIFSLFVIGLVGIAACAPLSSTSQPPATLYPVAASNLQIVTGQTIYVPAYSSIFYGSATQTMDLSVTLAIHNTDTNLPIIIQSVTYHDTDGALVREYIDSPVEVPPLATTGFVVEDSDQSGGWGANFIVIWGAEQPVYEPIIEAIMVSTRGNQGISFISPGRVVSQTAADAGE